MKKKLDLKCKGNPSKIMIPLKEVQRYQKWFDEEWERREEEIHAKSSRRAAVWYQAITYLALCNVFDFSNDDLFKLQEEMDRIAHKIMATDGKHKNYSINTVRKELLKYNVEFDMDEVAEMES